MSTTYSSVICNSEKKDALLENVFWGSIQYFKSRRNLQNSYSFLNSSWNIIAST